MNNPIDLTYNIRIGVGISITGNFHGCKIEDVPSVISMQLKTLKDYINDEVQQG